MAYGNYGLVIDSKFKARSFDDLIKPLAMYTQEYNTLEQGISYDVAGGINEMPQGPMSIHQVTYFELLQHPHNLDVIIADGLVAKGYNASTTKRGLKG